MIYTFFGKDFYEISIGIATADAHSIVATDLVGIRAEQAGGDYQRHYWHSGYELRDAGISSARAGSSDAAHANGLLGRVCRPWRVGIDGGLGRHWLLRHQGLGVA